MATATLPSPFRCVRKYLAKIPEVRTLVIAQPTGGPSGTSVKCGHPAFLLAERVASELRSLSAAAQGRGRIHIFIAAPNAFVLFLGQNQSAFSRCSVYEFDCEGRRGRTYSLGLSID